MLGNVSSHGCIKAAPLRSWQRCGLAGSCRVRSKRLAGIKNIDGEEKRNCPAVPLHWATLMGIKFQVIMYRRCG